VKVRIVEAGKEQLATRIDDAGLRAAPRVDIRIRTNSNDAVAEDGHSLRRRHRGVDGPDFRVRDYQIGGRFRIVRRSRVRYKHDGHYCQHRERSE
jgi:hypothetical protein